jgi:TRAP-type mannitol/chloroaromatic compound transport system permease large subunit
MRGDEPRMSTLSIGLGLFGAMLVLMAIRVPIAVAMFVPGAVGYVILSGWSPLLAHLKGAVYGRVSVYDLSVIPLFMLMGAFAVQGGLSKALFDFANALLGRFKGGMAMARVLACAAFGSISGSRSRRPPPSRRSPIRRCAACSTRAASPPRRWPPAARWACCCRPRSR